MNVNDIEYRLALAVYVFNKNKIDNVDFLTDLIKKLYIATGQYLNMEVFKYNLSCYKMVDPYYTAVNNIVDNKYHYYFDLYRKADKKAELLKFYQLIKSGLYKYNLNEEINEGSSFEEFLGMNNIFNFEIDEPINYETFEYENNYETKIQRSNQIRYNALSLAGFNCELDSQHKSFVRNVDKRNYTEGHHLIPIKAQSEFNYSLDVESNIVSLCPNCHRMIHYGKDNENIIRKLFDLREDRLILAGIKISYEDLLHYYKGGTNNVYK
ncbi:MAG: HNH endonuclease [Erysipelotrichaceae bacterium]